MIKNNVKKIRCERGMTQEHIAQAVGVSRQTIISLEKGNYIPSVELALKLARFFKTSVEHVFII